MTKDQAIEMVSNHIDTIAEYGLIDMAAAPVLLDFLVNVIVDVEDDAVSNQTTLPEVEEIFRNVTQIWTDLKNKE